MKRRGKIALALVAALILLALIPQTREIPLKGIALHGPKFARPWAIRAIRSDPNELPFYLSVRDRRQTRKAVADALLRLEEPPVAKLLRLAEGGEIERRCEAVGCLSDLFWYRPELLNDHGEAIEALLFALLETEDPDLAWATGRAIVRYAALSPEALTVDKVERVIARAERSARGAKGGKEDSSYDLLLSALGRAELNFDPAAARSLLDRVLAFEDQGLVDDSCTAEASARLARRVGPAALSALLERRLKRLADPKLTQRYGAFYALEAVGRELGSFPPDRAESLRAVLADLLQDNHDHCFEIACVVVFLGPQGRDFALELIDHDGDNPCGYPEEIIEALIATGPPKLAEVDRRWKRTGQAPIAAIDRALLGDKSPALKQELTEAFAASGAGIKRGHLALALWVLDGPNPAVEQALDEAIFAANRREGLELDESYSLFQRLFLQARQAPELRPLLARAAEKLKPRHFLHFRRQLAELERRPPR